jgi:tetratricopeptide (TPR) repeat protein
VRTVSQCIEAADRSLHPLSGEDVVSNWREVIKSPGWLAYRNTSLGKRRHALHLGEADRQEAAKNWFAAAFHLRWLCKMEPKNTAWQQRLARAQEQAYYGRGEAYSDKKDYEKAIVDYTEAIRLDPTDEMAYFSRGIAYSHKKDYDKAIADYTEAIRLDPTDGDAFYKRGLAYKGKLENSKAEADFAEAKRLEHTDK